MSLLAGGDGKAWAGPGTHSSATRRKRVIASIGRELLRLLVDTHGMKAVVRRSGVPKTTVNELLAAALPSYRNARRLETKFGIAWTAWEAEIPADAENEIPVAFDDEAAENEGADDDDDEFADDEDAT